MIPWFLVAVAVVLAIAVPVLRANRDGARRPGSSRRAGGDAGSGGWFSGGDSGGDSGDSGGGGDGGGDGGGGGGGCD